MTPQDLAARVRAAADAIPHRRFLLGIAGAPGSGKSTLAEAVAHALGADARVVPMDGFHFDDRILLARGHRDRKGAPHTFDVAGFQHLLMRLRSEEEVAIPVFDRAVELSRAGADVVTKADRIAVIEGNYLLYPREGWQGIRPLLDMTVFVDVPEAELVRRLQDRWRHFGKSPAEAMAWIDSNDLPNIRLVREHSIEADLTVTWQGT